MGIAVSPIQIDSRVSDFIAKPRKMLINGKWVNAASGKTFPTYNPATGEVLAQVAEGDRADIDAAVQAARRAFDSGPWSRMTASERGKLVWKLAELLEEHLEELATLETLDNGKPAYRSARPPMSRSPLKCSAIWRGGRPSSKGRQFRSRYRIRRGLIITPTRCGNQLAFVGQIIPWNFPLLMAAWKLAPALASGCTVVLKPAEQTPLSALRLGELITEAGFPDGVVNIVPGYGETAGAALAAHDLVDKIGIYWIDGSGQIDRSRGHGKSEGSLARTRRQVAECSLPGCGFRHGDCRFGERDFLQSRPMLLRRFASVRGASGV